MARLKNIAAGVPASIMTNDCIPMAWTHNPTHWTERRIHSVGKKLASEM